MPPSKQPDLVPISVEGDTPLALRFHDRCGGLASPQDGRKRCRSESDDDFSATDSEEGSSLDHALDSDSDTDPSENTTPPQTTHSEETKRIAQQLAGRVLLGLLRWMSSARYIQPPEHRIPPRKRSRSSDTGSPSIFIETQDPRDPSTILILRIDGYFRLACSFFALNPDRHESCALEHGLSSISDLIKHLAKCHPSIAYCPVCGQTFDSELGRDTHIRASTCVRQDFDTPRGVSRSQLRKIIKQDDRNQRESKRWQRIYSFLFPEAERPRRGAAFLGEGLPLAVSMASDYWALRGRRLTEEYLANEGSSKREEIVGEGLEALVHLAGRELIQRVIADARDGQFTLPESDRESVEPGWENMKANQE